jgi:hypothetical protein
LSSPKNTSGGLQASVLTMHTPSMLVAQGNPSSADAEGAFCSASTAPSRVPHAARRRSQTGISIEKRNELPQEQKNTEPKTTLNF